MSDIYYWIIQVLPGAKGPLVHGPYKSKDARDSREENIKGGEVHCFQNFSPDPSVAKQEFLSCEIRGL
jgi:hypothetical protein